MGYSLLHEFHPKRLAFFTDHKFPVDEVLEVEVNYFGTISKLRVLMVNVHEHISSSRVMTQLPSESEPCPIRKFYRCYADVQALEGVLPGVNTSTDAGPISMASAAVETPAPEAGQPAEAAPAVAEAAASAATPSDSGDPAPTKEPPIESVVETRNVPKDSDAIRSQLAALSALDAPSGDATPEGQEPQAA